MGGQSFHFATKYRDENFATSIKRHEFYLASRLDGLKTGSKLLDCGCGIGGPMRNIAKFTGCNVTGITLNQYQVDRGNELNRQMGLVNQCKSVQGDFMKLPFENASFDGVYAIEATCHAPDRTKVFGEIFRVLKPGNFCMLWWCLTDKYDKNNKAHRLIKKQIEEGDGLPDTAYTWEMDDALKKVGFELTDIGMPLTTNVLKVMEFLRLAPAGTSKVQTMLQQGAIGLAQGGEQDILTHKNLCVERKPVA